MIGYIAMPGGGSHLLPEPQHRQLPVAWKGRCCRGASAGRERGVRSGAVDSCCSVFEGGGGVLIALGGMVVLVGYDEGVLGDGDVGEG
jgi:hypothetical protein